MDGHDNRAHAVGHPRHLFHLAKPESQEPDSGNMNIPSPGRISQFYGSSSL